MSIEDATRPTALLESTMLTGIFDTNEERDVLTSNVPNNFIQTDMTKSNGDEVRVITKIKGVPVNILVEMAPKVYGQYVVYENGHRLLYAQVERWLKYKYLCIP